MNKFKIKGVYISQIEIKQLADDGLKYCSLCKHALPFNLFKYNPKSKSKLDCNCRECDLKRQRNTAKKRADRLNSERIRLYYNEDAITKKVLKHINGVELFRVHDKQAVHKLEHEILLKYEMKYCGHCGTAHDLTEFNKTELGKYSRYCRKYKQIRKKKYIKVKSGEKHLTGSKSDLKWAAKTDPGHVLDISKAAEYHRQNKNKFAERYNKRLRGDEV